MIGKNSALLSKTYYSQKEDFYSYLNMEDITDVDYTNTKRGYKDFKIKNKGYIIVS